MCVLPVNVRAGLDATSALRVALVLKEVAQSGLTVAAVLHQPRREVMELLDDLVVSVE